MDFIRFFDISKGQTEANWKDKLVRSLNSLASRVQAGILINYAPGGLYLPDGVSTVMVKRLTLTGNERATLEGDSRLRIL